VATLEVNRRSAWGLLRRLRIEVDGSLVLKLPTYATRSVEVEPGFHAVAARMDWAGSPALGVMCGDEEPTRVQVVVPSPWSAAFRIFYAPDTVFEVQLITDE
jgi:hypothetical protein